MKPTCSVLVLLLAACVPAVAPGLDTPPTEVQQASPEACPAIPIATFCEPGAACWKNPHPIATTSLTSVWSFGCTAWAVGRDGLVVKRTAEGWKPQPAFTAQYLYATTGTAEDDVWAVGMNSSIFHFDGTRWTEESIAWNTMPYQAVWSGERGVVFVAGFESVDRYEKKDGRVTFTTLLRASETHFTALIGEGATLRALGGEQTMLGWKNVLWSFDGSRWTKSELSDEGLWLSSLISVDGELYGAGQRRAGQDAYGYLSQLAPNSAPSSSTDRSLAFGGLAARSSKEIIAVGTGYPDGILRFDGLTFTPVAGAPERTSFFGITQSGRDYFLIGQQLGRISDGTFIPESEGPTELITGVAPMANGDVWLSNGWRSTTAGGDRFAATFTEPNRYLTSVSGLSSDDVWATDAYSGLWHFDGSTWSRPAGAPASGLKRVVITAPDSGFAWGNDVWRFNGSTWSQISFPRLEPVIHDVMLGTDGVLIIAATNSDSTINYVFRVDAAGVVTDIPAPQRLRLLAGLGSDDVFGVGEDSLFHFDGSTWSRVGELPQVNIMAAAMKRDRTLLFATSSGSIVAWGGSRYFERSIGASVVLFGLTIDQDDRVWVTGEGGAVVVMP